MLTGDVMINFQDSGRRTGTPQVQHEKLPPTSFKIAFKKQTAHLKESCVYFPLRATFTILVQSFNSSAFTTTTTVTRVTSIVGSLVAPSGLAAVQTLGVALQDPHLTPPLTPSSPL